MVLDRFGYLDNAVYWNPENWRYSALGQKCYN